MGQTLRLHVINEFTTEECCVCGIAFAMTTNFQEQAANNRSSFFCPNGHRQIYQGKTESQKLREQLDRKESELRLARGQRDAEQNRARAIKGHLTRAKKRAAAGTCPCCRRTFSALATHMRNQHPEFVDEHRVK